MRFFDRNPVLYPWPGLLRQNGLTLAYKPREVFWKDLLKKLKIKPSDKVLEVGCGRGIYLDRISKEFKVKTYGIDLAKSVISDAREQSIYDHYLRAASATRLPFKDNFFDIVVSFDTLEHIKNQKRAVSEMVRVLKPQGKLLIYTINKKQTLTWNQLLSRFGVDIYKGVDHDPKFFIDPKWLGSELEKNKIMITRIDYIDSFFALIINEIIMVFCYVWQKLFKWEKTEKFGMLILMLLSFISYLVTPLVKVLDLPWTAFGFSNGFSIIGQKHENIL